MTERDATRDAAASPLRVVPLLATGLVLLALACGLGAWIHARGETPFAVDSWWNTLLAVSDWSSVLGGIAFAMNFLGGGWFAVLVIPLGGTLVLILLRRPWTAAFFLTAEALSAGLVQLLKGTFGRARPEEILVLSDYGSFPSGHTANAATLAAFLVVIFPRVVVVIIGAAWVLLMAFTRTYLHAHWLSDTFGGALVGVAAVLLVAAAMARPLGRELAAHGPRPPVDAPR